jgi:hypothetical protein
MYSPKHTTEAVFFHLKTVLIQESATLKEITEYHNNNMASMESQLSIISSRQLHSQRFVLKIWCKWSVKMMCSYMANDVAFAFDFTSLSRSLHAVFCCHKQHPGHETEEKYCCDVSFL